MTPGFKPHGGKRQFPTIPVKPGIFPDGDKVAGRGYYVAFSRGTAVPMSLRGQFLSSVILALLLGLGLEAGVACWHARVSVENEMRKALDAADRIVDNALLSLPASDQDAYLARLVQSFDGNRHIRVILVEQGRMLSVSRVAAPEAVPGWFQTLLEIPREVRQDGSPRLAGRQLLVQTDPHNEISEAWGQLRDSEVILLLFSLLVVSLLHLVMVGLAAPLKRLGAGFDAVGGGDYAMRVVAKGPREMAYLAQAFNRMVARLGGLEAANRRMAGQMLAIQEEERSDLARDLHDEMGPFLFAVRVDAEAIATLGLETAHDGIVRHARAITDAVSHIQAQVRLILKQLRPGGEVGLAQAIANLAAFWQRHHESIAITLHVEVATEGFGPDIDAVVFRLIQEGLTNAARHSQATRVWVTVAADRAAIHIVLEDDGVGFVAQKREGGLGLAGMRERLAPLSGALTLEQRPGGGARLVADIPRQPSRVLAVPA